MSATEYRIRFLEKISLNADLDYDKIKNQLETMLRFRKKASVDYINILDADNPNAEAKAILKQIIEETDINIKQLLGL